MRDNPNKLTKRQKRDDMARKKEERAQRAHYRKQKKAQSYLSEDEGFVSFSAQLSQLGLQLRDIPGDGNCLFRALGDQHDTSKNHQQHRQDTVEYMLKHRDDFEPFVEDDVPFERHVSNLKKPGTYAGNDAIVAFSRLHKVHVVIHQLNSPCWEIHGTDDENARQLHISYHNGDHYSSVRKVGDVTNVPPNIKIKVINEAPAPLHPWQQDQTWVPDDAEDDEEEAGHMMLQPELRDDEFFNDVCDIEDRVMCETGCKNRELVRQALEETHFSIDEAILYTLQLMTTLPQHGFLDEVDSIFPECTNSLPTSSGGAKPKKTSRQSAKEKKLEKKKRATERHKSKVTGQDEASKQDSQDEDDEEHLIQSVNTLKI